MGFRESGSPLIYVDGQWVRDMTRRRPLRRHEVRSRLRLVRKVSDRRTVEGYLMDFRVL